MADETSGARPLLALTRRIYISNLDFNTTEEELLEFLSAYHVISVLIPCQTIRGFRKSSVRPLGIAYAEFGTIEEAENAVHNLNGQNFKERVLRIKPYKPFSPSVVKKSVRSTRDTKSKQVGGPMELRREPTDGALPAEEATIVPGSEVVANSDSQQPEPVSEDTVYCAYLPGKVTDVELRAFFGAYEPQDIYVFKSNGSRRGIYFHRRFTAALVTLGSPEFLQEALVRLGKQKLVGKRITLKPARLSKIKEVHAAAAKKLEVQRVRLEPAEPPLELTQEVTAVN